MKFIYWLADWFYLTLRFSDINNIICRNAVLGSQRLFSTKLSDQIVTPYPPLSQPLANLPTVQYAKPNAGPRETRITTLPNGLRVASESRFGQFCTIGGEHIVQWIWNLVANKINCITLDVWFLFPVVIDSGPRYEVAFPSGVSHYLEKLAFHVRTI